MLRHSDEAATFMPYCPAGCPDRFINLPSIDTATLKEKLNMYFDDECETCDREFGSQQAAIQHMDALNH